MLRTGDVPRQIAVLILSADSYLENRFAIEDLLPRLVAGGTLFTHRRVMALTTSDPVADYIRREGLPITLSDLGNGYAMGTRGTPT